MNDKQEEQFEQVEESIELEEITIMDIFQIILKGKWIILATTILAAGLSFSYHHFFKVIEYEVSVTYMVEPKKEQRSNSEDSVDVLLDDLSQYPDSTKQVYMEQIKNPLLLERVINRLDITDLSVEQLRRRLVVRDHDESKKTTDFFSVSLKGTDNELITNIINTLSDELNVFLAERNSEKFSNSVKFLGELMEEEEEQLMIARNELREFLSQPKSPQELKAEIDARIEQLTLSKTRLAEIPVQKSVLKNSADALIKQYKDLPEKQLHFVEYRVQNELEIDEGIEAALEESIYTIVHYRSNEAETSFRIFEMNTELSKLDSEEKELKKMIESTQITLEQIQSLYEEKRLEYEQLQKKVEYATETYKRISEKYEELRIARSIYTGEPSISVMAPAMVPSIPLSSGGSIQIVIAALAGFFLSAVSVFAAYLIRGGLKKNSIDEIDQ